MRNAIRPRQEKERGRTEPRDELKRYLEGPLVEGVVDVVRHWGVSHLLWFEVIIRVMLTYLTVPSR
jgi:hypothetical protein